MYARASSIIALLALADCGAGKTFDAAGWKNDEGQAYESARPSMLDDFRHRYPVGSNRSDVLAALGASEANFPDICRERPGTDRCAFYFIGANGIDPIVFVVGFRGDKTVAYLNRTL